MQYVYLGKTNLLVSRLCFGALTIGPVQSNLPLDEGSEVIAKAITSGINFIDTAQLYKTYGYIREGMKRANKFDIVISSKTYAYNRDMAREAVEEARRELDRDYIDIFLLHEQESIHTLRGHKEALDYLLECKEKGIIKAVGCSTHHVAGVYGAIEFGLDIVHPLINLTGLGIVDGTREQMEAAVKKAHQEGIGVFSMKALGGGNLFKKAEECFDYILSKEYIDSVAVGMQCVEEVEENIRYFEFGTFSNEGKEVLAKKERQLLNEYWCDGCGACVIQCPQKALYIENGQARCTHEKCLLCGYCAAACPRFAIKII